MRHREIAKTHDIIYLVSAIPIVSDIIEGHTAVIRAGPCISLKRDCRLQSTLLNHWYDSVIRGQSNDDWCKLGVLELDIRGCLQGGQRVGEVPKKISS
jgi:hypothetical protein